MCYLLGMPFLLRETLRLLGLVLRSIVDVLACKLRPQNFVSYPHCRTVSNSIDDPQLNVRLRGSMVALQHVEVNLSQHGYGQ